MFFYCDETNVAPELTSLIVSKWDCLNYGGEWFNKDSNFDSLGESIITLFSIATTEGWTAVMWDGVDETQLDYLPKVNNQIVWVLFFIGFIVVGSLFVLNLFVGVVINTFD